MKRLFTELTIAMVGAFLASWFTIAGLLTLFILTHFIFQIVVWQRRDGRALPRVINLARFFWDFLYDLAKSNLLLAWDVITPKDYHHVRLVEVPLRGLSEEEISLLIHRITLTPGTLSCDVVSDRSALIVHAMYGSGPELAHNLRRPLDILRGEA